MLKSVMFENESSAFNLLMGYIEKLDRTLADMKKDQSEQPVFVKEGSRIMRVDRNEILYLEGYGDYVKIHRVSGKPLLSQISLKKFETNLPEKDFCRVHRSFIVSIQHISYIEKKRIRIGSELIPISDSYLPVLMKQLLLQE